MGTSSCNHNIFQSRSQSFQPKKNSTYSITVPIITNMADATTEPKVAPAETEKPLQVEAKDEAPKETPPTLTEQASSAASAAATTATTAASNVADNVFSMFFCVSLRNLFSYFLLCLISLLRFPFYGYGINGELL